MAGKRDYDIPDTCRYSTSDEWVRIDDDGARIGITDYAQGELSDVVFVELPEVGAQVEAGQSFGVVESVKAVSDLIAPLSGEVVAVHRGLDDNPEWVNEDPYGRGWIVCIAPDDPDAYDQLLSPDAYRKSVEERTSS
jgi:glycine cleavage system H protein